MQSNPLIESVRALVARMPIIKTCKPMPVVQRQDGIQFARPQDYEECDMRLVLAALERAERIEEAAKKLVQHLEFTYGPISPSLSPTKILACELNAALKESQ